MLIGDTYDICKISCRLRPDLLLIGHLFGLMDDLQCVSLVGDPFVRFFLQAHHIKNIHPCHNTTLT